MPQGFRGSARRWEPVGLPEQPVVFPERRASAYLERRASVQQALLAEPSEPRPEGSPERQEPWCRAPRAPVRLAPLESERPERRVCEPLERQRSERRESERRESEPPESERPERQVFEPLAPLARESPALLARESPALLARESPERPVG